MYPFQRHFNIKSNSGDMKNGFALEKLKYKFYFSTLHLHVQKCHGIGIIFQFKVF